MNIEEFNYTAMAFESTSMAEHLVEESRNIKVTQSFVILLDNDNAGKITVEKLLKHCVNQI